MLLGIMLLSGCSPHDTLSKPQTTETIAKTEFTKGVWLSFNEIGALLSSDEGFENGFSRVVENLKTLEIKDLYFHVRSHCDSVVKSEYFPQTDASKTAGFDVLEYAINVCHANGIRLHAWVNPYRVTASHSDIAKLPQESPVLKWLTDDNPANDTNAVIFDGIYLNPAENEARNLILNGVKEIITKYNVYGIHFDDYFYPTEDPNFDTASYESYKQATPHPLSLYNWRRANVDTLIADCSLAIKNRNKDLIFSISPSADIDKNYNISCADIKAWCHEGLIDEVIPQLYFGFSHTDPNFNFDRLLSSWLKLCKGSNVKLKIGLAAYKVGSSSPTDGEEWLENNDILSRQVNLCKKENRIEGISFFSYTSLFSKDEANTKERDKLIRDSSSLRSSE